MVSAFTDLCLIWYWAVFCPSRINSVFSLNKRDASINNYVLPINYLFLLPNAKLVSLYFKLIFIIHIPLIIKIWCSGQTVDFGLLVLSLLSSYLLGLFSFPLGLHFPILFFIFYKPSSLTGDADFISNLFYIHINLLWFNILFFLAWGILVGLVYLTLRNSAINGISNQKLIIKSIILSTLIILFIFNIYLFLYSPTSYSLSQIAIAVWIVSFSSAPSENNMTGVFVIPILIIILMSYYKEPSWIFPATLIPLGFLRLFPDYIVWSCISLFYNLKKDYSIDAILVLPPFTNEVLWIPVLAQSQIIKTVFKSMPEKVYLLAKKSLIWSSFYNPFQVALPQIIYAEIGNPQSIEDITIFGDRTLPITKITELFVTTFTKTPSKWALQIDIELETLLPQIINVSKNIHFVNSDHQKTNSQVENIITEIDNIKAQIPRMDLSRKKRTEWYLLLTKWQEMIETVNLVDR